MMSLARHRTFICCDLVGLDKQPICGDFHAFVNIDDIAN